MIKRVNIRTAVMLGFLLIGGSLLWQGSYIKLKASLADLLIRASWVQRQAGQVPVRPWPWADTRVVARLSVNRLGIRQFVMQDASGESLAFGPGSMIAGRSPGGEKYSLITGHRDTHFKFLSEIEKGDLIEIENHHGQYSQYRISGTEVLNVEEDELRIDSDLAGLTLLSCWPLDALIPGGPLRLLVHAERVDLSVKPGFN